MVTPRSGPLAGNTAVSLFGVGFQASGALLRCTFGSVRTPATFSSATKVVCLSPLPGTSVAQTVIVGITCNGVDYSGSTANTTFTYMDPTFVSLNPSVVPGSVPSNSTDVVVVRALSSGVSLPSYDAVSCRYGLGMVVPATVNASDNSVSCSLRPTSGQENVFVSFNGMDWFDSGLVLTFFDLYSANPSGAPMTIPTVVQISGFQIPVPSSPACQFGTYPISAGTTISASVVQCTTPAAATPGPLFVEVSLDGKIYSAAQIPFAFYVDPTIIGIAPPSGQSATVVTITGSNFIGQNMPVACRFGVSTVISQLPIQSGNQIICIAPAGTGSVPLKVSLNGGVTFGASSATFLYIAVGVLSPVSGPSTGNTLVAVQGSGFLAGALCRFGATTVTAQYISTVNLKCVSPALAANPYSFEVSNDGVTFTSSGFLFTYYALPTVVSVAPIRIPDTGLALVTITGTNFFSPASSSISCKFNTFSSVGTFLSATTVSCMVPKAQGIVATSVSFNGGADYSATGGALSVFLLASQSPSSGPASGGTTVFFSGAQFLPIPAAACKFNGNIVPATITSPTDGSCVSPSGTVGVATFDVSMDGLSFTSSTFTFTYYATPVASLIAPVAGPSQGGYPVTVYGSNFVPSGGVAVWCRFGARGVVSTTYIPGPPQGFVCLAPLNVGTVNVSISLNDGSHFSAATVPFRYYTLFLFAPTSGPTTGATPILLFGSNFPVRSC